MIIIILSFTSTLDLNLAIATACELCEISLPLVRTRVVHLRKNYMPSGKEAMLKSRQVFGLTYLDLGYVSPRPMVLVGTLEEV